jgi:uncharacterized protein (TIGR03083 family)
VRVEISEHLEHLERDGALLASAAASAGWDAPVPSLRWTVRDLVTHLGGVHRWAAAIVRDGATSGDVPEGRAVGRGPGDGELIDWFAEGLAALVATLRSAPVELTCLTFLPAPSALAFWARRQAHETAIHRADAQAAAGTVTPFDAPFAQDGIAELLLGFAARRSNAVESPGTLFLHALDGPDWLVTLGGERTLAEPIPDDAAQRQPVDGGKAAPGATVTATSSELYLWLWNRPAQVSVLGDAALAEQWRQVRVRWS